MIHVISHAQRGTPPFLCFRIDLPSWFRQFGTSLSVYPLPCYNRQSARNVDTAYVSAQFSPSCRKEGWPRKTATPYWFCSCQRRFRESIAMAIFVNSRTTLIVASVGAVSLSNSFTACCRHLLPTYSHRLFCLSTQFSPPSFPPPIWLAWRLGAGKEI